MTEMILFSLEQCPKCLQTKELMGERNDIEIVTFPHDINQWNDNDFKLARSHDVFEELQKTAPILWIDGRKTVGYLRIRKWLQDTEK